MEEKRLNIVSIWVIMRISEVFHSEPTVVDIAYSQEGAEDIVNTNKQWDSTYCYEGPFKVIMPDK